MRKLRKMNAKLKLKKLNAKLKLTKLNAKPSNFQLFIFKTFLGGMLLIWSIKSNYLNHCIKIFRSESIDIEVPNIDVSNLKNCSYLKLRDYINNSTGNFLNFLYKLCNATMF